MDERIKRTNTDRSTRAVEDVSRVEDKLASSAERRKMFREFTQEALPTPPAVPGWHFCWLSTTNQYDPIHKRMRMGYEPVKAEEVPGFEHFRIKSGEYEGMVSVNEMLLFKIPQELYQEIMEEYHHNMPMEEENMLKQSAAINERDSNGRQLGMVDGEGLNDLGRRVQTPVFM